MMNSLTHISVVHIACRLITGRRIAFLYDLARASSVEIAGSPDSAFISEFEGKHRTYIPGFASECRHECTSDSGQSVEIFINERTFIAHFRGTDAYFIGNIQRDIIYIYDQRGNMHFKYRITCLPDEEKKTKKSGAASSSQSDEGLQ